MANKIVTYVVIPAVLLVGMALQSYIVEFVFGSSIAKQITATTQAQAPEANVDARTCGVAGDGAEVQRFAKFLTFQSLGSRDTADHIAPGHHEHFQAMLDYLESSFPEVYKALTVEKVGVDGWSRLYTWPGSDPSLHPVLYISHYDVVPAPTGKDHGWQHGPFDGEIVDGYVWGRGALDVKFSVTSILEAVTRLLAEGYKPKRTVLISFGHDEELGGERGAAVVAELLQQRGVQLDMVVDEGGVILKDGMKGLIEQPVALVGTAEKLYTSVLVEFTGTGGHSSMPPLDYSDVASQMSRFMAHATVTKPYAELLPPVKEMLQTLAPYAPPLARLFINNADTWPFSRLLTSKLARSTPETQALVRTTMVVTQVHAGVADNVIPGKGWLTVNVRSHPSVLRQDVLNFLEEVLTSSGLRGLGTQLSVSNASYFGPPSVVTPTEGRHYQLLKQAIQEYWRHGDAPVPVAPLLMAGGTDSKHFASLSPNGILRFVPYMISKGAGGELETIHARDERVRTGDYANSICTYERLLTLLADQ